MPEQMSSNCTVVNLPRTAETRLRCLKALVFGLIVRDRSEVTLTDAGNLMQVLESIQCGEEVPECAEELPDNARHALVAAAFLSLIETRPIEEFDMWLNWNWRGLTHPEEFPLHEKLGDHGCKTSIDQRNRIVYRLTLLEDDELLSVSNKIQEFRDRSYDDETVMREPPF